MKPAIALLFAAFLCCLLCNAGAEDGCFSLTYDPNGAAGEAVTLFIEKTHLFPNTAQGDGLFHRPGHTLYAWNTAPDGTGIAVGLGSRVMTDSAVTLYAQWAPWTDEALFTFENGVITGYTGSADPLVIPETIEGQPVYSLGTEAFAGCSPRTVILPPTLKTVAFGAFRDAAIETLYLFDTLQSVSDYSFQGCDNLQTLRVNAASPPVYPGSYFSTFADKSDRLFSLAGQKKIVLFSGSSARFGYDSEAIDKAFPDYQVVNMGVFAYTNALPQLEIIRGQMSAGDVLLLSPELDAAKRQFCTSNALDAAFFNLLEENYDLLTLLDLREDSAVFSSLSEYLSVRRGMEGKSYALSPADFDEDGHPVSTPSYNEYGDYILYRPNALTDAPIYGLAVPYTAAYYRKEIFIDPLNAELERFTDGGVGVYITWSPRNRLALSEDSTWSEIEALDAYFRENLAVPVISPLSESLYDGRYLSGTDNHLSTEGVTLRTERVIRDLGTQMYADGLIDELPKTDRPKSAFILSVPYPVPLGLYGLAFLSAVLGVRMKRGAAFTYVSGFLWAGGAIAALLCGGDLTIALIGTMPPLLATGYLKKGRERS